MPRPRKRRRVHGLPEYKLFGPYVQGKNRIETISMSVEEYEVIRLIDLEGLEQEECAKSMDVARSTIQRMYIGAKQKVADSLVNGKTLKIEGGDYVVCEDGNCNINTCNGRGNGKGHGWKNKNTH